MEPKICPCTSSLKPESFFFFIIIFDIVSAGGNIIGLIFPLVGICVYSGPQDFKSGYFKFYAIARLLLQIITFFIILILFIAYFFIDYSSYGTDVRKNLDNKPLMITFFTALFIWMFWMIYLSYQFFEAISVYQDGDKKEELVEEDEVRDEEKFNVKEKEKVIKEGSGVDEAKDVEVKIEA